MPPAPRVQRLVQQVPSQVRPISTKNIPANHQTISQRLLSQSAPNQLEPDTATNQTMTHSTQYCTTHQSLRIHAVLAAQRKYPSELINLWYTPRSEEHT